MADEPDKFESIVGRLLREQPLRRAPRTLEMRVLARIGAQPGWRRGFVHWPPATRVLFLVASAGFVKLALMVAVSMARVFERSGSSGALGLVMSRLHAASDAVPVAIGAAATALHAIPAYWLYGAAILAASLYAALFGLGTVAYRILYVNK